MSTLDEIRDAISQLSLEDRATLAADLCGWEDDEWDLQMKRDAAEGKFDQMNESAASDMKQGRCIPLEEGL